MVEQKEQHFEVQDKNKERAYKDQQEMRKECKEYVDKCSVFNLQIIYAFINGLKK
tara:strand:+ start:117 stop:281 length:165 start_codon:yes stop_codon:yes gene_type:complete